MTTSSLKIFCGAIVCFLLTLQYACARQATEAQAVAEHTAGNDTSFKKASALRMVPEHVVSGEPFLVQLSEPGLEKAVISFLGKKITVTAGINGQNTESCTAMLALPLDDKQPSHPLTVTLHTASGVKRQEYSIQTVDKEYPVQQLTVAPKYASPPKAVQERIAREQKETRRILAQVSEVKRWATPFIRPVPGEITSEYGLRREFNGLKRNPHRGLDLDGNTADPILAASDGTVVYAGEQYYSGNMVILDHGLGVFTLYMHMNDFAVSKGQEIKKGEKLGGVGATGRVTGPHLHLGLSVLGNSVNPTPMLEPYK